MILSIIIPIYNVEQYLELCLDSIHTQQVEIKNFEVIIVNDGTPDNSMAIVKRYSGCYSNLGIIEQENQGLSVARNVGFKKAKGDYVWFVDSDDWLTENAISYVIESIKKNPDVEVFATVLNMFYEKSGKTIVEYKPNLNVKTGRDYMFKNNNANRGACQRYIFKRSFLIKNNLEFMPGVYHEDGEFANRMLYLAERLIILPVPVYNYRIRANGSIMSSRKMKMNYDLVKIYYSLLDFAEIYVKGNKDYWQYREKIFACLSAAIQFSRKDIFSKEFDIYYQENKKFIKQEARKLLPHYADYSLGEILNLLQFSLCPKLSTQIKQSLKWVLIKIGLLDYNK